MYYNIGMKRLYFCIAFVLVLVCSCTKDKKQADAILEKETPIDAQEIFVPQAILKDFYTLDYTPQNAEKSLPSIQDASLPIVENAIVSKRNIASRPTINMEECAIKYQTQFAESKIDSSMEDKENIASDNATPFCVCDWGPKENIADNVQYPEFFLMFSEPVVPISALNDDSEISPYMQIEPKIKGVYRWKGTSLLCFEAQERINPLTSYKIKVNEGTTSLTNKRLTGLMQFTTKTKDLKIDYVRCGSDFEYFWELDDLPVQALNNIHISFNYAVQAKQIAPLTTLFVGKNKEWQFNLVQETVQSVCLKPVGILPENTPIIVQIKQNANRKSHPPLVLKLHSIRPLKLQDTLLDPIRLQFSHAIDESSVKGAISFSDNVKDRAKNAIFEVKWDSIIIKNLELKPEEKFDINVNDSLCDIYGQKLSSPIEVGFKNVARNGYVHFGAEGTVILEKNMPHTLAFRYLNAVSPSAYRVKSTDFPFEILQKDTKISPLDKDMIALDMRQKNSSILKTISLDPYLKNGMGIVNFVASITVKKEPSRYDNTTKNTLTNATTIQVTDLAITARYSINKVVALVSSLATGKGVSGATVNIYPKDNMHKIGVTKPIATCKTNDTGLAVIDIKPKDITKLYTSDNYNTSLIIEAQKDSDRVLTIPYGHYQWRSNILSDNILSAYKKKYRTFMFTDRGIYKKNEVISFRGIDRTQVLNRFSPYCGDYTITLENASYDNNKIYVKTRGTTSLEGGFSGYITVPNEMEAGYYYICYARENHKEYTQVYIGEFERLNFETKAIIAKKNIVAGDKINAIISANYLAGGTLEGASASSNWFVTPCVFAPDSFLNDYTFGPVIDYKSTQFVQSDTSYFNKQGLLETVCNTDKNAHGMPYNYKLSSTVTDSSMQAVNTTSSVVVHPAFFYIGVKPRYKNLFVNVGEKQTFDYMITDTQGNKIQTKMQAEKLCDFSDIEVCLTRQEWHIAKQQGVSNYIYNRYEKLDVEEDKFNLTFNLQGSFDIEAQTPGFYTVHIRAKDTLDREVLTQYNFYVTGTGYAFWYNGDTSNISIIPDKNCYKVGESAKLLLQSELDEGDYLITVEREGIFSQEVRHIKGNATTIDIKIAKNFVPVVYISVASYNVRKGEALAKFGEMDINKPKSYYGVAKLFIDTNINAFSIKIDSEKTVYKTGDTVNVTLTATKDGEPVKDAELTLMAVDRGVLDTIDYHVANPIDFFYSEANFPLCVKGGDTRFYLMNPVNYTETALSGGDASSEKMSEDASVFSDFNPTVAFIPFVKTDAKGCASCSFVLNDNLTTYRLTAFGVKGELFALNESQIRVQSPITVKKIIPETIKENDTIQVGLLITNHESEAQKITVSLSFMKDKSSAKNYIAIEGKDTQSITLESGETESLYFTVAALKSSQVEAVFDISASTKQRLISPLNIACDFVYRSVTQAGVIDENETVVQQVALPAIAQKQGELCVSLGVNSANSIQGILRQLQETSWDYMEFDIARLLAMILYDTNVKDTKVLREYQKQDGGFDYWKESSHSYEDISATVAHLWLYSKQNKKLDLGIDSDSLMNYITRTYNRTQDSYIKAYTAYIINLYGKNPISDTELASLCSESSSTSELCLLALASLKNNKSYSRFALDCQKKISQSLKPTARGIDIANRASSYSNMAEIALVLHLFYAINPQSPLAPNILHTALEIGESQWQNPQYLFFMLEAFYTVLQNEKTKNINMTAKASLEKKDIISCDFTKANARNITKKIAFNSKKNLPLSFEKKGQGRLYYTATLSYPEEREIKRAIDRGLCVNYELFDESGHKVELSKDSCVVKLKLGKVYKAFLTLSTTYNRQFVALKATVPSGARVLNAALKTDGQENSNLYENDLQDTGLFDEFFATYHYLSSRTIYTDNVQFFWRDFARGRATVEFDFRTQYCGIFPTIPAQALCLHSKEVSGFSQGFIFVIE